MREYKRKVISYEAELAELRRDLASARRTTRHEGAARAAEAPALASPVTREKSAATAPSSRSSPPAGAKAEPDAAALVEQFAKEFQESVEEGRREQFQADLKAYAAELRARMSEADIIQRKARAVEILQEQIAAATDVRERESLERRMEKIQAASPEDLPGVLSYYEEMDTFQELNRLMDEYNISREDLREYGIEPPPRRRWGPDAREIAWNLGRFVENYAPLVDQSVRDQYRRDFESYLNTLSSKPTEADLLQKRNQMLGRLQEEYNAAGEEDRARIKRQMERVERYSAERLRRQIESDNLRALRDLAEKYDLPRSEMRQSGVWAPTDRRRRQ